METESTDKRLWTRASEDGKSAAAGMSLGSGGGIKTGAGGQPQPYGWHGYYGETGGGGSNGPVYQGKVGNWPQSVPPHQGTKPTPSPQEQRPPAPLSKGGRVVATTRNDDPRKDDPNPEALTPETREQVQSILDKNSATRDVNMNSAYRSGDGVHGEGRAVDINRVNSQKVSDANNPNVPAEQREVMRERLDEIKTAAEANENVEAYLGPNGGFFRRADGKIGRKTKPEEDDAHQDHVHITIRKPPLLRQ